MPDHEILNTPHDSIHYREYKIILQPEHFQTAQAFVDFWKIVCHTAKKFDVKVKESENPFLSNVREVLFFDTSDFALYKNHFIVRLRTHYKNGWPQGIPELTVKFRHPDFQTAAAVDVRPATPGGSAKIKFKAELLPLKESLGGSRSIFSHNCVLAMPRERLNMAVRDLTAAFPAIKQVEANIDEPVRIVNDRAVDEVQVDVGELHFGGGLTGKTTIAVWRLRKYEQAFCGEFAFQCRFESENDLHKENLKRLEDFYNALQLDAFEWVSLGTTKTALVYDLGCSNATGSE
ncbi:MAG: hypothetical protein WCS31_16310 [Verrucomicrobiae bacterium]